MQPCRRCSPLQTPPFPRREYCTLAQYHTGNLALLPNLDPSQLSTPSHQWALSTLKGSFVTIPGPSFHLFCTNPNPLSKRDQQRSGLCGRPPGSVLSPTASKSWKQFGICLETLGSKFPESAFLVQICLRVRYGTLQWDHLTTDSHTVFPNCNGITLLSCPLDVPLLHVRKTFETSFRSSRELETLALQRLCIREKRKPTFRRVCFSQQYATVSTSSPSHWYPSLRFDQTPDHL